MWFEILLTGWYWGLKSELGAFCVQNTCSREVLLASCVFKWCWLVELMCYHMKHFGLYMIHYSMHWYHRQNLISLWLHDCYPEDPTVLLLRCRGMFSRSMFPRHARPQLELGPWCMKKEAQTFLQAILTQPETVSGAICPIVDTECVAYQYM